MGLIKKQYFTKKSYWKAYVFTMVHMKISTFYIQHSELYQFSVNCDIPHDTKVDNWKIYIDRSLTE